MQETNQKPQSSGFLCTGIWCTKTTPSDYKDKFIIKGGILISDLVGISTRTIDPGNFGKTSAKLRQNCFLDQHVFSKIRFTCSFKYLFFK